MPDLLRIRTAQNVEITYEIASIGSRIGAYFIDWLLKIAYICVMSLIMSALAIYGDSTLAVSVWMVLLIPVVFYSLICEKFNEGQTPGKQAVNIKVVSMTGDPVSTGMYLLRWLFRIVDFHLISGIVAIIAIAAGNKGQRIGDMVADTSVIRLRGKYQIRDTAYAKVDVNYQVKYPSATQLEAKDISLIKEVLNDKSDNRFELIKMAAEKIEGLIQVQREGSSETFLRTIIKDYNHQIAVALDAEEDSI